MPGRETVAARRLRHGVPPVSTQATVSLVRVDSELRWIYQRPPSAVGRRRAGRAAAQQVVLAHHDGGDAMRDVREFRNEAGELDFESADEG